MCRSKTVMGESLVDEEWEEEGPLAVEAGLESRGRWWAMMRCSVSISWGSGRGGAEERREV